jgi:glycosyl transferase family 87
VRAPGMTVVVHPWIAWGYGRALAIATTAAIVVALDRIEVFSFDYVAKYGMWAGDAFAGSRVPYQDFAWEYPPLALPVMGLPHVVALPLRELQVAPYWVIWILMLLAIDAWVMRAILVRVAEPTRHPAIQVWLWGPPLLGALCWVRFDLLPAAAALAALLVAGAGRSLASGIWGGVGASLKIWPGLLVPVQRTRRSSVRAIAAAGAVIALVVGVTFLLTGSTGFAQVLQYQADRGLQVESVLALPLLWADRFGVARYGVQYRFGAWELVGPGTDLVAGVATGLFIVGIGVVGLGHWRMMRHDAGARGVGLTGVLLLLVSMATNKVFSPQYVIWLIAGVAAAAVLDPEMWRPAVKPVVAIAALTQLIYPVVYPDLVYSHGWIGPLVATIRDGLVVWLLVRVAARWRRHMMTGVDHPHEDRANVPPPRSTA